MPVRPDESVSGPAAAEVAPVQAAPIRLHRLGRRPYEPVWQLQREMAASTCAGGPEHLILVEHDAVVTMGRRTDRAHLLLSESELEARGILVYDVERGGDVTYHGPGQLVAYPILDLRRHRKDVRWYSTSLAAVAVQALATMGVEAEAREGLETGVWVTSGAEAGAKIAAIGIRVEGWVTYHGVAINVDMDMTPFDWIVPCGLPGVRVTTVERVAGTAPALDSVGRAVEDAFAHVFGVQFEVESVGPINDGGAHRSRHPGDGG
jgi:lipoyl(octanoyl) transferase